jgi:hypothetical protein
MSDIEPVIFTYVGTLQTWLTFLILKAPTWRNGLEPVSLLIIPFYNSNKVLFFELEILYLTKLATQQYRWRADQFQKQERRPSIWMRDRRSNIQTWPRYKPLHYNSDSDDNE